MRATPAAGREALVRPGGADDGEVEVGGPDSSGSRECSAGAVAVGDDVGDLLSEPGPRLRQAGVALALLGHRERQPAVFVRLPDIVEHLLHCRVFSLGAPAFGAQPRFVET